jgi:hypothetical protein
MRTYFFSDVQAGKGWDVRGTRRSAADDFTTYKETAAICLFEKIKRDGDHLVNVGDLLDGYAVSTKNLIEGNLRFLRALVRTITESRRGNHDPSDLPPDWERAFHFRVSGRLEIGTGPTLLYPVWVEHGDNADPSWYRNRIIKLSAKILYSIEQVHPSVDERLASALHGLQDWARRRSNGPEDTGRLPYWRYAASIAAAHPEIRAIVLAHSHAFGMEDDVFHPTPTDLYCVRSSPVTSPSDVLWTLDRGQRPYMASCLKPLPHEVPYICTGSWDRRATGEDVQDITWFESTTGMWYQAQVEDVLHETR